MGSDFHLIDHQRPESKKQSESGVYHGCHRCRKIIPLFGHRASAVEKDMLLDRFLIW